MEFYLLIIFVFVIIFAKSLKDSVTVHRACKIIMKKDELNQIQEEDARTFRKKVLKSPAFSHSTEVFLKMKDAFVAIKDSPDVSEETKLAVYHALKKRKVYGIRKYKAKNNPL